MFPSKRSLPPRNISRKQSSLQTMWTGLGLLLLIAGAVAFECDSDVILQLATKHREKDVAAECDRERANTRCEEQDNVNKLWKEFEDLERQYKHLVSDCVKERESAGRVRRHDHDPNDPNIDHTGHNHRRRRHDDHDPNDPNVDHTGHNHRLRRHGDHDPNDPNVDHTGHNHRRRRHEEHDPNDPNVDHTGHNHRSRRHDDHDPNDPNVDHTGHNHKRRHVTHDAQPYSEPERQQLSRTRRQLCNNKASESLTKLHTEFKEFCTRGNVCLPDEDLPAGVKRDKFKEVSDARAKKYTSYLLEAASCNAN